MSTCIDMGRSGKLLNRKKQIPDQHKKNDTICVNLQSQNKTMYMNAFMYIKNMKKMYIKMIIEVGTSIANIDIFCS